MAVAEARPGADGGWTLVQAKTRHARIPVNDANPASNDRSMKKSKLMKGSGVYDGVGILRHSTTGLERLNKKVNWKTFG